MERVIFHIDVNSAFLSWTAIQLINDAKKMNTPVDKIVDIREIPSIIGGDVSSRHGIVVAKSIPAKKYGIETAEPVVSAVRKCPNLSIYPPDHKLYKEKSNALMNYLRNICPVIEQVSIDECYMDFTSISNLYSSPEEAACHIKDGIRDSFGFTVNIGISDRKVLAKMASDFEKPDKVHTLYSHEIQKKMWPLSISNLFMCGKSSVTILYKLGILTIGDLANANPDILQVHLKSHGLTLYNFANGIDSSIVTTTKESVKGVGNSITLSQDVINADDAKRILHRLSESVSERLKKAEKVAGIINIEIKYATFDSISHQTGVVPTSSLDVIHSISCNLFDDIWDGNPIRLLGIRTSKLTDPNEPTQLSLFDYQEEEMKEEKKIRLENAFQGIRGKYGDAAIRKAKDLKED